MDGGFEIAVEESGSACLKMRWPPAEGAVLALATPAQGDEALAMEGVPARAGCEADVRERLEADSTDGHVTSNRLLLPGGLEAVVAVVIGRGAAGGGDGAVGLVARHAELLWAWW